jgi:membrane protein DedA with SNARE-associated domain
MGSWITDTIVAMGYFGVLVLTLLENVFPPIPSELILPLGGYLVSRGHMALVGVIAAATVGSLLGAVLLYWIGRAIGEERLKTFAERHGCWLGFSPKDIERVSAWFDRHGGWAVFVCRMIPGVRSLISIPAGLHRMPLLPFLLYTAAGTVLWTTLLVWLGYLLGANFERIGDYIDPVTKVVFGAIALMYLWRVARQKGLLGSTKRVF